jgi:division protein CdvB (Snf7/Vps24/ESCRT-III family)
MGSLKKFAAFLSGQSKKKGEDPVRSAITQLKIFNHRLQRQTSKMETQQKLARDKAISRRKAGDIAGSKLHMKSSLQFQKWVHATENFRVRLDGVQFKLEQAKAMNDFTGVAQDIAGILTELQLSIKAPEIAQMLAQLDFGFGTMDSLFEETAEQMEISEDASSTSVSESEVENALAEVDAELSLDTRQALPSVPGMAKESEINDLEAEIKRLKSQRD